MISLLKRRGMMKVSFKGRIASRRRCFRTASMWVDESNAVRAVDVFVDALELRELGFDGVTPAATGRLRPG